MKIFIAGGSGVVGKRLVPELVSRGQLCSYDSFGQIDSYVFWLEDCSEFACQSSQSCCFLQIVPIVQIINSITYVE